MKTIYFGWVVVALVFLGGSCAEAAVAISAWTGGAFNKKWSSPGNWAGGDVPQSGDRVYFPGQLAFTHPTFDTENDLPNLVLEEIEFDYIDSILGTEVSGYYKISGLPITLTQRLLIKNENAPEITVDITLGGNLTIAREGKDTDDDLVLPMNLALGSHRLTLQPGPTRMTLSGRISGSGTVEMNYAQNSSGGTVELSGTQANTYTGLTTIEVPAVLAKTTGPAIPGALELHTNLSVNLPGQFGSGHAMRIDRGGDLFLNGNNLSIGALVLNGYGTLIPRLVTSTGTLTLNDSVTVRGPARIEGKVSLASGNHGIDVAQVNFESGDTLVIDAAISGGGGLVKTGAGTLILRDGPNTYGGTTSVADGRLVFDACEPGDDLIGTQVNVQGRLVLSNAVVSSESLTLNADYSPLLTPALHSDGVSEWNGNIVLSRSSQLRGGGDLRVAGVISGPGDLYLDGDFVRLGGVNVANTFTGKSWIGATNVVLQGQGTRVLLPGAVEVRTDGTLRMNAAAQFSKLGEPLTIKGIVDLNGFDDTRPLLALDSGTLLTGTGTLTLAGGVTGSGSIEGKLSFPAGLHTMTVPDSDDTLRLEAAISGSGGLRKVGAGKLILGGFNFYSGETRLEGGRAELSSGATFGAINSGTFVSNAVLTIDTGSVMFENLTLLGGAHLALNNHTNVWTARFTNANNNRLTLQKSSFTMVGPLHGSGVLYLDQSTTTSTNDMGVWTVTGPATNSFTGSLRVEMGTLILDTTNAPALPNGATLDLRDRGVAVFGASNQLGDTALVKLDGRFALLDLNGFTDEFADVSMQSGRIETSGGSFVATGTIRRTDTSTETASINGLMQVSSSPAIIDITNNAVLTINARILGGAALSKTGGGILTLAGSNAFSGPLTIADGLLFAPNAGALGTPAGRTIVNGDGVLELWGGNNFGGEPITLNSSGTAQFPAFLSGGGSNHHTGPITLGTATRVGVFPGAIQRLNGAITGAGGLIKEDLGTLILAGSEANTYGGPTTVAAGILQLSKPIDNATIPGNLTIGGTPGTAAYVKLTTGEQIADTAGMNLLENGWFDQAQASAGERFSRLQGTGAILLGDRNLRVMNGSVASTFAGTISGTGNLVKEGTARLRLTGASSFSGLTQLQEGSLDINGALNASEVRIASGATLGGTGTIFAVTALNGGLIAPGTSPGRLTVLNNLTMNAGSIFRVEMNGTNVASDFDQITAQGSVTLNNPALSLALGFASSVGQRLRLIDKTSAGAITGTFSGLAQGATLTENGSNFDVSYIGGTGNDFVLQTTVAGGVTNPPVVLPRFTAISRLANGNIRLEGTGQTNETIVIEFTDNFEDWTDLGTRPVNDGTFTISDSNPGTTSRFYRARQGSGQ